MASESVMPFGPQATIRYAPALLDQVRRLAAEASYVVVDCKALDQVDTAGLQVLLALRNALSLRGGEMRVVNVPVDLGWRFDFAGLAYTAV